MWLKERTKQRVRQTKILVEKEEHAACEAKYGTSHYRAEERTRMQVYYYVSTVALRHLRRPGVIGCVQPPFCRGLEPQE